MQCNSQPQFTECQHTSTPASQMAPSQDRHTCQPRERDTGGEASQNAKAVARSRQPSSEEARRDISQLPQQFGAQPTTKIRME